MVDMKRFFKSFLYALTGIRDAFKTEQSFRLQILAIAAAAAAGIYLGLSPTAWGLIVLAAGLVLAAELFNTAVERLGDDSANGQYKQIIKRAKDISAGAVLVSALTALVIGIIFILIPLGRKIVELWQGA